MATTVRTLVEQALGLSLRNRRESIANETTELVQVVQKGLMEAFGDAAGIYPEYFGTKEAVPFSGVLGGWARPSRALVVYRIENPSLVEVVVVGDTDRQAERFSPSVVERGRVFYPGETSGSPTAGDLSMFYARSPVQLSLGTLDQDIDSLFPDDFINLLVLALGVYMATKDQRADEVPALQTQLDEWRQMWQGVLRQATTSTRYRFTPRTMHTPSTRISTSSETA